MEDTELIDLVLRAHEVSFVITGPWAQETEVTLALPDLRSAPRRVRGDWGPMYAISLSPDLPIEVSVRSAGNREDSRETLELTELAVESPMLAATRAVLPLVMELPLSKQQARLRVFYDTDGCAVRAELLPTASREAQLCAVGVKRFQPATRSTAPHPGRPGYADHVPGGNSSRV